MSEGAFSIAATWIWAPALFIAAREAYVRGITGLLWFLVPNILCLILFSYFAKSIRKKMPEGFTFSDFVSKRYSKRVQKLYWIELTGLAACSFAVQLLAGAKVVSALSGIPFSAVTVFLTLIALSYSLFAGLKASVVTDHLQMMIMLAVGFTLVPWAVIKAGGVPVILKGLGGLSGEYVNPLNTAGLNTAWIFGVPVTIGLIAGPFGDQSFWQRAFAVRKTSVQSSFVLGALVFGLVPLVLSLLGFVAAGAKLTVNDAELINLEVIIRFLPLWTVVPFVLMLVSGLASTLDSNLCSISSIAGHDLTRALKKESGGVYSARLSMLLLAGAALLIANIPGLKILYLFLFYGTLRASTLLPSIFALATDKIRETGVFWGIILSFFVGLPLFAYGKMTGNSDVAVWGSIITVVASGTVSVIFTFLKK
jgi:Na+/proline symporter